MWVYMSSHCCLLLHGEHRLTPHASRQWQAHLRNMHWWVSRWCVFSANTLLLSQGGGVAGLITLSSSGVQLHETAAVLVVKCFGSRGQWMAAPA